MIKNWKFYDTNLSWRLSFVLRGTLTEIDWWYNPISGKPRMTITRHQQPAPAGERGA